MEYLHLIQSFPNRVLLTLWLTVTWRCSAHLASTRRGLSMWNLNFQLVIRTYFWQATGEVQDIYRFLPSQRVEESRRSNQSYHRESRLQHVSPSVFHSTPEMLIWYKWWSSTDCSFKSFNVQLQGIQSWSVNSSYWFVIPAYSFVCHESPRRTRSSQPFCEFLDVTPSSHTTIRSCHGSTWTCRSLPSGSLRGYGRSSNCGRNAANFGSSWGRRTPTVTQACLIHFNNLLW
jgi:hypothetical protein